MKRTTSISLFFLATLMSVSFAETFENPRIGIVISKASYEHRWGVTQMSAHGWAGVVNLAGIPYDCLFIDDIAQNKGLRKYDLLIFAQCPYVEEKHYNSLVKSLKEYLSAGGNLIVDGPLAVNDEKTRDRNHEDLDALLGVVYDGFHGDSNFRIKTSDNSHFITRNFERGQFITQHLVNGLNIMSFEKGGTTLLSSTDENESHPFLSGSRADNNRILLVSDFSTWSGAASFFRNVQPQVFYANQLYNILIRAVYWGIYGDLSVPFPAPQVSNAKLTAIVRLDADASSNLDAQIKTMNYLINLAKETGVVPLYAWVSSGATKAGWQDLAPLGQRLEEVGGEIGTHSKFHRIDQKMNSKRWQEELEGAIEEIEFNMNDYGYPIGKVEWFINPGNTIRMKDYEEVASHFSFYMTHGFEQDMPLGWGNLTWFTGPHKNLVLLENIPAPDYQWFYDPSWSYTTAQITAYEEAIFDHLFDNIGRGVIFNEMWHDYSITTQPQAEKDRIVNDSNIAFYDALKAKFATHQIYCPTPEDLGHKLRAMAQWDYSWQSSEDRLEMILDLSAVRLDTIPHFVGGMGIAVENTGKHIKSVEINGRQHFAFDRQLLILPNLLKGKNKIVMKLTPQPADVARLTFISKRMPAIRKDGEKLIASILTRSKAKFSFFTNGPSIAINADWQEWGRTGDNRLNGYVTSNRDVVLTPLGSDDFALTYANVKISDFRRNESALSIRLRNEAGKAGVIHFSAAQPPLEVRLADRILMPTKVGKIYQVTLPESSGEVNLDIRF